MRNWYELLGGTVQEGGNVSSRHVRPYIQQHAKHLKKISHHLRSNRIDRINIPQQNSLYGLVNLVESILGNPLNEGKFTTLVKNMSDRNELKKCIRSKSIPESIPSKRLRPLYNKYTNKFQLK